MVEYRKPQLTEISNYADKYANDIVTMKKDLQSYKQFLVTKSLNEKVKQNALYETAAQNLKSVISIIEESGGFLPIILLASASISNANEYVYIFEFEYGKIMSSPNPFEEIMSQIMLFAMKYNNIRN
jgi:capsular polysaccharide biosynthesis protein